MTARFGADVFHFLDKENGSQLERVYDPFLFPVLGTKESIKKGQNYFRDSTCSLHLSKI